MSTAGSTGAAASTGAASTGGASTGAQQFSWGDGWRTQLLAGSTFDVATESKRIERFESPPQIYRSFRELEAKLSSGEYKRNLPKDATAEEVARWRTENGMPSKPEEYKITMPDGKEPPKEDDAFLAAFRKSAFEANYTQQQFDKAVASFYAEVDRQTDVLAEAHKEMEAKTEDALRQEWGAEYRANKAMALSLLARAPAGFQDKFLNGFLADHTPIKASPEAWKWLVQMEREINPYATVVPGAGGDLGKTIDAEITELETLMGNKASKYWKGPEADKLQQRYRDLINAREKNKQKTAA